jgi:TRAP-type C4-dicarboxylate transport system substrate-binding protein
MIWTLILAWFCLPWPPCLAAQKVKPEAAEGKEAVLKTEIAQAAERLKPPFDHAGAFYKARIVSVAYPGIWQEHPGTAVRDALWKATKGEFYLEYIPLPARIDEQAILTMLAGQKIQGAVIGCLATATQAPRLDLVNLPFLAETREKLEKFLDNRKLSAHFWEAMADRNILGLDMTSLGRFGWASRTPLKNLEDVKKAKLGITKEPLKEFIYQTWGLSPAALPSDTPLRQGDLTALETTLPACLADKQCEDLKNFTSVDYAQSLFVWLFQKSWLHSLPQDLQDTLRRVIKEQCALYRQKTAEKELKARQRALPGAAQMAFWSLPPLEARRLRALAGEIHQKYAPRIGPAYLAEVQGFLGFAP